MKAAININKEVHVVLNEAGRQQYIQYFKKLFGDNYSADKHKQVPENGFMKFQLWELFHYFGEHIWHGANKLPFVSNMVILELADLEEVKP